MEFVDDYVLGKIRNDPLARLALPKMDQVIEFVLAQTGVFKNRSLMTAVLTDLAVNYR